jgi:hypothetical protein
MMQTARLSCTTFCLAVALASGASLAAGPTFTVSSGADVVDAVIDGVCETQPGNGTCTLRAAVMEANATTGATIRVGPYGILLTLPETGTASGGDLDLLSSMTIEPTAPNVFPTVTADGLGTRMFEIGGAVAVTIRRITMDTSSMQNVGGCVYNAGGDLTLEDLELYGCNAVGPQSNGGAVYSTSALHLKRVQILQSHTTGNGGGIYADGPLDVTDSEIGFCSAGNDGGGLLTTDTANLTRSTLNANTALRGAGLTVLSGTTRIVNSTISTNSASGNGGGIFNAGTTLVLSSTITNNRADSDSNGSGDGGGVENTGSFTFTNTALAGNFETAPFQNAYIVLPAECLGTIASGGHNLVRVAGSHCTITGPAPLVASDPKLGTLEGNEGGWTRVHRPLADSPAINAGSGCVDAFGTTLTTDQRGVKRQVGNSCDIGSVEREPAGDVNGDGSADVADVFALINWLFAGAALPPGRTDMKDDYSTGVDDVFYLINYLFAGGPAPIA